jgi:hypothetical protein
LEIADVFGVRFVAFGEAVQESEDLFRGDLINGTISEFPDKSFDYIAHSYV